MTVVPAETTRPAVLVTGGAGFIGSRLVEALLARGERVRVLDDLSSGSLANLAQVLPDVELLVGDLRDGQLLERAVADAVSAVGEELLMTRTRLPVCISVCVVHCNAFRRSSL